MAATPEHAADDGGPVISRLASDVRRLWQGAESKVYRCTYEGREAIAKRREPKA